MATPFGKASVELKILGITIREVPGEYHLNYADPALTLAVPKRALDLSRCAGLRKGYGGEPAEAPAHSHAASWFS